MNLTIFLSTVIHIIFKNWNLNTTILKSLLCLFYGQFWERISLAWCFMKTAYTFNILWQTRTFPLITDKIRLFINLSTKIYKKGQERKKIHSMDKFLLRGEKTIQNKYLQRRNFIWIFILNSFLLCGIPNTSFKKIINAWEIQ